MIELLVCMLCPFFVVVVPGALMGMQILRDLARWGGDPWAPLVKRLGGSGGAGNAVVEIDGHQLHLIASDDSTDGHRWHPAKTWVSVTIPGAPWTLRKRLFGDMWGLTTHDEVFDRAFWIDGDEDSVAWFTAEARELLLRQQTVDIRDGTLRLTFDGFVEDLDLLHDALLDAARLASALTWDPSELGQRRLEGTRDPVPSIRRRSLEQLMAHHPEKMSSVDLLGDPDPAVRVLAASWVDAPHILLEVLAEACPHDVRKAAVERLATSAALSARITPRLQEGLMRLVDADDAETSRVALDRLADGAGPEVMEALRARRANAGWFSGRRRQLDAALTRLSERHKEYRGGVALAPTQGSLSLASDSEVEGPDGTRRPRQRPREREP